MQAFKKNQQATSASKKQKKTAIKNILASPFANYWPLISPEDNSTITEILTSNLPRIKHEKINVPWRELKNIPREERKTFRDSFLKGKVPDRPDKMDRSNIVLGVNQVTVALEEKSLIAVVIANDVQPRFMVKHIIDMCVLYSVPILIMTDLRKTLQIACGITSLVLGLKSTFQPDSKVFVICQSIKRISENYPIPKNHINFVRRIDINSNQNEIDEKEQEDTLAETETVKADETPTTFEKSCKSYSEKPQKIITEKGASESEESDNEICKRIYLIKKSPGEEVFVPKFSGCGNSKSVDKMEVDSTGFLSFLTEPTSVKQAPIKINKQKTDHKVNYKSLVIKRLKGNSDRNKKKIDKLKTKIK